MTLTLTQKVASKLPLDAECLKPETVATLSLQEIGCLQLTCGNELIPLSQCFDIAGDPTDLRIELHGDLSALHYLGKRMEAGEIVVHGPVGRHAGSIMTGGSVTVHGNAGDWLGAEMRGGTIHVRGSAGNQVGGAYPGSLRGMNGGTILIEGNCGNEAGLRMRRGMIAIAGEVGSSPGRNMLAGTLLVEGKWGSHPGLGMKRGSIILLGDDTHKLPPGFSFACRGVPTVLRLVDRELASLGFPGGSRMPGTEFMQFSGDRNELGKGEVFVPVLD